jgi:hypothetical protein
MKFKTPTKFIIKSIIVVCALMVPVSLFAQAETAIITFSSGKVLVLKDGKDDWQTAETGRSLVEGDMIKTFAGGSAELTISPENKILLKENTCVSIRELVSDSNTQGGKTELFMIEGKVKAVIDRIESGSSFSIKTPTSIAGVRGTIFYLNVTEDNKKTASGLNLFELFTGTGICYAAENQSVTEIFVEKGSVDFTSLLSDVTRKVGEGEGSYADDEGNIPEPERIPKEKQNEWKKGFGFAEKKGTGGKDSGDSNKKDEGKKTSDDSGDSDDSDDNDIDDDSGTDDEDKSDDVDTDNTKDDKEDNSSDSAKDSDGDGVSDANDAFPNDPSETKDTDGDGVGDNADAFPTDATETNDTDGDGVGDNADEIDDDANFSKWTDSSDSNSDNIPDGKEDYQIYEEIRDLYNDIRSMGTPIQLAGVQGKLEQIADNQEGKTATDMNGNSIRIDSYVMQPKSDTAGIMFLTHRRTGTHAGVSSISLQVKFNQDIDGADFKSDLPWNAILSIGGPEIDYGNNEPAYSLYQNTQDGFNPKPTHEIPAVIFRAQNPSGDIMEIYEGYGALYLLTTWQQGRLEPLFTHRFNDTYVETAQTWGSDGTNPGGHAVFNDTLTSPDVTIDLDCYVVNDSGVVQLTDSFNDGGTSQDLSINSVRNLFDPDRDYSLEFTVNCPEIFCGRTIDATITQEVLTPYTSAGAIVE